MYEEGDEELVGGGDDNLSMSCSSVRVAAAACRSSFYGPEPVVPTLTPPTTSSFHHKPYRTKAMTDGTTAVVRPWSATTRSIRAAVRWICHSVGGEVKSAASLPRWSGGVWCTNYTAVAPRDSLDTRSWCWRRRCFFFVLGSSGLFSRFAPYSRYIMVLKS